MITRQMLDEANDLNVKIGDRLNVVGRTFYEITKGKPLNHTRWDGFYYADYQVDDSNDSIRITFESSSQAGTETETVRVPISYLDNDDWQFALRDQYAQARLAEAETKRLKEEEAVRRLEVRRTRKEDRERAQLARLIEKYGVVNQPDIPFTMDPEKARELVVSVLDRSGIYGPTPNTEL